MNGRTDGWIDGWMDEWVDPLIRSTCVVGGRVVLDLGDARTLLTWRGGGRLQT